MARHRKIDVRMWGDSKFCSLSKPAPNGQTLWVYLLTGPHTTSIPGIFTAGESALAEAIGWPLKGFRKAFAEARARRMVEADWKARVVWIPNAVIYNPPESANVVKSWRHYWDEIPECELKVKAWHQLKAFLEGIGEGWARTFTSACADPSPNQEQEQEQEQEQDTPIAPKGASLMDEAFERFWAAFPSGRKQGKGGARKAWESAVKKTDPEFIIAAAREYSQSPVADGDYVKGPAPWLNQECWNDDRAAWRRNGKKPEPQTLLPRLSDDAQ